MTWRMSMVTCCEVERLSSLVLWEMSVSACELHFDCVVQFKSPFRSMHWTGASTSRCGSSLSPLECSRSPTHRIWGCHLALHPGTRWPSAYFQKYLRRLVVALNKEAVEKKRDFGSRLFSRHKSCLMNGTPPQLDIGRDSFRRSYSSGRDFVSMIAMTRRRN
jgi:hypothetical protein